MGSRQSIFRGAYLAGRPPLANFRHNLPAQRDSGRFKPLHLAHFVEEWFVYVWQELPVGPAEFRLRHLFRSLMLLARCDPLDSFFTKRRQNII
jgi:hypothetical protein